MAKHDDRKTTPRESDPVLRWAMRRLPEYFSDEPSPFHRELFGLLGSKGRLLACVAPRGHAKSTCVSFAYPLYSICEKQHRNIVIVSHEASLATQFVRDIRSELETNDALLDEYGDLTRDGDAVESKPKSAKGKKTAPPKRRTRGKWAEAIFTAASGVTVQAKGAGAAFRGMRVGANRPDLIICDDIEKDDRVASAEGRRKLEHWLRRVVMPALAPGGKLVVIGSILHFDSLLAGLADRGRWPRWDYRVYRALEAEPVASTQPGGPPMFQLKALWPARWPVERLQEERQRIGTLAFEQEYQANPVDDSLRVFRPEWLRRTSQQELARLDRLGRIVNLIAVDPATGTSGGDFFAMWVGGVDAESGVIHTRELLLERIGIVEQVRRIVAAFERWRPVRIGIETVAYQAALRQVLEEHSRKQRLYMPIVGINAISNKRARIEGSACFYENGSFLLPEDLSAEAESQFLHFPRARHDDAPDVCAMAIELARGLRGVTTGLEAAIGGNGRLFEQEGGW
ncbi:MAG: hypothetical protein HZB38_19570 [Planctomycetes bacterium]|nr:hypothetical protein [Planctomycetota bacterium]